MFRLPFFLVLAGLLLVATLPASAQTPRSEAPGEATLDQEAPDSPSSAPLTAPEDAVCPVSGLYPAQHPEWLAVVKTIEGTRYHLASSKSMFKFVQDPARFDGNTGPEGTFTMMVTDYNSHGGENADECWYVVGSSVEGPSGRDYVPFRTLGDAQQFSREHEGGDILKYSQIDKRMLLIKDK